MNRFVPDLVMPLTMPPAKLPWRTSYGATITWNSDTASMEIARAPDWPPGTPDAARPKRSLLTPPSICRLL